MLSAKRNFRFSSIMDAEAIAHKHAWLVVSSFFSLRVEHTYEPLQAIVHESVYSISDHAYCDPEV
jgi:hypothetical protein